MRPLAFLMLLPLTIIWLSPVYGDQKYRLGDIPDEQEKPKTQESELPVLEEPTPEEKKSLETEVVNEFYDLGLKAFYQGHHEQAEGYFDRVLILNPHHKGAQEKIAFILKKYESSEGVAKKKVPQPKTVDPKIALVKGLETDLEMSFKKEKWEEANHIARKILAINPDHQKAKDTKGAIKKKRYLRYVNLAKTQEKNEKYKAAVASYKKALNYRNEPSHKDDIKRLQSKITSRNKGKSEKLYLQALQASQEGTYDMALQLCEQALSLDEDNLRAQRMLKRLQAKPLP